MCLACVWALRRATRPQRAAPRDASAVAQVCSVGALRPDIAVSTLLVPDDFWCPFGIQNLYEDKRGHFMPRTCARGLLPGSGTSG